MTLAAGSRLGPYEILTLIGAGGMGKVTARSTPARSCSPSVWRTGHGDGWRGLLRRLGLE